MKGHRFFTDMSFKSKLLLLIMLVVAIISSFSALSFYYVFQNSNALLYSQTANALSFFSDELLYQLKNMEDISSHIAFDQSFQTNLDLLNTTDRTTLASQNARNTLLGLIRYYYSENILTVYVEQPDGKAVWWGAQPLEEPEDALRALYARCDETHGKIVWSRSSDGESILCTRTVFQTKNLSLKNMGHLVIQVDLDRIIDEISRSRYALGHQFNLFILSEDQIIYPFQSADTPLNGIFPPRDGKTYEILLINDERMFVAFGRLNLSGINWHMALGVPYDDIFHSLSLHVPLFGLSLLLSGALALLIAMHIIRNITYQFNLLVNKMERVKLGNFISAPVTAPSSAIFSSKDEMTILNTYFDQMTLELKRHIEDSYIKQLLITQAEFKALEQQINPHFLYNTLNTADWLAKKAGAQDISVLVESLAALLRTTLQNHDYMTPIRQEMELVENYVRIQQIRFPELSVTSEIDQNALHIPIPKMTIQPLVENAILHSHDEALDEYLIHILVQRRNEVIHIEISDNGPPIDENILQHLQNKTVIPQGNGVGLLNIDSRLRIIFGESCGLFFVNQPGCTIVGFDVPVAPVCPSAPESEEDRHV